MVAIFWKKEDELRDLKSDLSSLDRQIQLSLTQVSQAEESTKLIEDEYELLSETEDATYLHDKEQPPLNQQLDYATTNSENSEQKIFITRPAITGFKH